MKGIGGGRMSGGRPWWEADVESHVQGPQRWPWCLCTIRHLVGWLISAERDAQLPPSWHGASAVTCLTFNPATSAAPAAGAAAETAVHLFSAAAGGTPHFVSGGLTLTPWEGGRGYSLVDLEEDLHASPIFLTRTNLPHGVSGVVPLPLILDQPPSAERA
jgi:hypothetical protein